MPTQEKVPTNISIQAIGLKSTTAFIQVTPDGRAVKPEYQPVVEALCKAGIIDLSKPEVTEVPTFDRLTTHGLI